MIGRVILGELLLSLITIFYPPTSTTTYSYTVTQYLLRENATAFRKNAVTFQTEGGDTYTLYLNNDDLRLLDNPNYVHYIDITDTEHFRPLLTFYKHRLSVPSFRSKLIEE